MSRSAWASAGTALSMRTQCGGGSAAAIATAYRCYSPPVDDLSAYDDLGQTPQGIPVRVFRPVAQASLRILVGSVLPHLQAGFGGGYKLIFPGTSHRTTLGALHRRESAVSRTRAGLLGDQAADNPMRQAIHAAATLLGPCWSVSHLSADTGRFFGSSPGIPNGCKTCWRTRQNDGFRHRAAPPADLVVAGNHPWPGDPMQSFKVLLHHRAACRTGGVLAGIFWTDPDEIDRSFPTEHSSALPRLGDSEVGAFASFYLWRMASPERRDHRRHS